MVRDVLKQNKCRDNVGYTELTRIRIKIVSYGEPKSLYIQNQLILQDPIQLENILSLTLQVTGEAIYQRNSANLSSPPPRQ